MPLLDDLVEQLTLLDEDKKSLIDRGFKEDFIEERKWRSCHPNNARVIASLMEQYPLQDLVNEMILLPHKREAEEWVANPQLLDRNILIPYRNEKGKVIRVRPHKRGFKGQNALVYRTPSSYKRSLTCIIAESEFKADAAELYGYAAIGIPGITSMSGKNWEYFQEELNSIRTNDFVICFDNEVKGTPGVGKFILDWRQRYDTIIYAYAMCQKILNIGIPCKIATLPSAWMVNGKVDIDMVLAQGRSLYDFKSVIDRALLPKEFLSTASIPDAHRNFVNRRVKRFFFTSSIDVIQNCFYTKVTDPKDPEAKAKSVKLTNCYLTIQNVYEETGGELEGLKRDILIVDEYGIESKPIPIVAGAMAGKAAFSTWLMSQGNYLFFGQDKHMAAIWEYVFNNDEGNVVLLINNCGFIREHGFYLFKNVLIRNGEPVFPDESGIFWVKEVGYKPNQLSNEESIPKLAIPEDENYKFPIEKFIELLGDTTDATDPGMAKALIGWVFATLFLEVIAEKYKLFPIMFLYGTKGSGKTTIMRWLSSFFGLDGSSKSLAASSPVCITRFLSYYSGIPLLTDDWRDDPKSKSYVTLFLGVYNRQMGAKGVKARFGVNQTEIRSNLVVMGEEMISDNGLASRCTSFYIPTERRRECLEEIEELIPMASSFTYEILTKRYEKLKKSIMENIAEAIRTFRVKLPKVEQRIAINYGILMGAYNAVMGEDEELLNYLLARVKEGQREISQGDKLHKFAEEFLFGVSENLIQPHHYRYTEKGKKLILWIKGIGDVMNKYYNRNVDSSPILLKHFVQQPYYIRALRVSMKGMVGKFPAIELDVSKMPDTMKTFYEGAYREEVDGGV